MPCVVQQGLCTHTRIVCATPVCSGSVVVSVSGLVSSRPGQQDLAYDFVSLVRPPSADGVFPLKGPTAGGTLVTVTGTLFNGNALVEFVERDVAGAVTGNRSD